MSQRKQILIIEDDFASATAIAAVCRLVGCEASLSYSGQSGLEKLATQEFALVVLDLALPDFNGIQVLESIRKQLPTLPAAIVSAHASVENAVAAKRLGVSAFLVKPLDVEELKTTIRSLLQSNTEGTAIGTRGRMLGTSSAMQKVFVQIAHACGSDAPVLICGPTGSGKTLASREIHDCSARREGPFVALHCNSVPETLLESELFGHEKNAFTGAGPSRTGHVERAAGGTLLLDEVGDIPPSIQAKLLRFVEERTFNRVGGREERRVDLRLIAATHRNLAAEVAAGRFREDLYYRLDVMKISMPSLEARIGDIPRLVQGFLDRSGVNQSIATETVAILSRRSWPGNVRQLRNAIEHAAAVCGSGIILPHHLPREFWDVEPQPNGQTGTAANPDDLIRDWLNKSEALEGRDYDAIHDELECALLKALLAQYDNKPTLMARALNINRVTLRKKCRRLLAKGTELP